VADVSGLGGEMMKMKKTIYHDNIEEKKTRRGESLLEGGANNEEENVEKSNVMALRGEKKRKAA